MVNKEKALERELTRLRKNQNPSQIDFRRMRKLRKAGTEYWKLRKKPSIAASEAPKVKKEKRKSRKERRREKMEEPLPELEVVEEEPELELIEDEPELEEELEEKSDLADELDDLYTYDDEIDEEE